MSSIMRSLLLLSIILFISHNLVGVVLVGGKNNKNERTADECRSLGFEKGEVKCRYCPSLLQHTESAALHQECLSCCTEDDQTEKRIYTHARIELRSVENELSEPRSEITMFHRDYKEKFGSRLTFVTRYNAWWPRLVLEDKNSGAELEVSLAGWTKDSLHDYLVQAFGMES
ncbi:uncharacterized protein TM35_000052690 [Trypanosoma theileri]|uniref:Selenoprotein F/M domain-containing protein n=1 Tax=Trypanosoma theileri TaxID=67003 RepID=A0A1X0P4U3_9TRYP|nr:uncharacterized protein TM35_000052690 [Trypanosoma theileri]ORC91673.1 hypothetical protein TM35_000052690 [Trypanosoma theileri]